MPKKSKCHHERRNSPSVASLSPTSSCLPMIFSISRSSTSASCAALISPLSRLARASFSGAVRKMLPTTSARNGGLVLGIGRSSLKIIGRNVGEKVGEKVGGVTSRGGALRQLQNWAGPAEDGPRPNGKRF